MKYNFKVILTEELYKIFLEDDSDFDLEYFNLLHSRFNEFRIKYDDKPVIGNVIDALNEIEYANDHFQILLVGMNEDSESILCYYYVGEEYGDSDKDAERVQALKDFKKIQKFKIEE